MLSESILPGYLTAIMDWHSRAVLSWRLSNILDTRFWLEDYNHHRIHQALDYQVPWSIYRPQSRLAEAA